MHILNLVQVTYFKHVFGVVQKSNIYSSFTVYEHC